MCENIIKSHDAAATKFRLERQYDGWIATGALLSVLRFYGGDAALAPYWPGATRPERHTMLDMVRAVHVSLSSARRLRFFC
jgi:hypothetical protein